MDQGYRKYPDEVHEAGYLMFQIGVWESKRGEEIEFPFVEKSFHFLWTAVIEPADNIETQLWP